MSTMTNIQKHKKDLSHIDTLQDLHAEIKMVKTRIKTHEEELAAQWKKLPAETFKVAVRKVLPFYLNNKILEKSWALLSGGIGLLKHDKTDAKKTLLGSAKKLGIFTVLRTAYNLWRKK